MWRKQIDNSWTLFLDRDGVINKRDFDGYISLIPDFVFLPFVFEGLKILQQQFSKIIIVTNQQGVGKGIMTEEELTKIHEFMLSEFKNNKIEISKIYAATNLKGAEIDYRKPNPSLALNAKDDFPEIDFKKSIMVGDTDSDLLFGKNLGMKTVLVKSKEKVSITPDLYVNDLMELANELEI